MDFKNYKGCSDKLALNYDSSVTVSCLECCVYDKEKTNLTGCMDRLASNYDPSYKKNCKDCCVYDGDTTFFNMSDIIIESENTFGLIKEDSVLITETGYVSGGWSIGSEAYEGYVTKLKENLGDHPLGFVDFDELVDSINKTITETPNSFLFINQYDLKPWLVKSNSLKNKGFTTFNSDCLRLGGSTYSYSDGVFGCVVGDEVNEKTNTLVKTKEGVSFIDVNPNKTGVIDSVNLYEVLINNQIDNGWDMKESSFFNTDLFMSIGLSVSDSQFVYDNYFNTQRVGYPNKDSELLNITGKLKSYQLLSYTFSQKSIVTPTDPKDSLGVVNNETTCSLSNGTFVSGRKYGSCVTNTNSIKKTSFDRGGDALPGLGVGGGGFWSYPTRCPTFGDDDLEIVEVPNRGGSNLLVLTKGGSSESVSQFCCNNTTLGYNLSGEWVYRNGRCELNKEQAGCKSTNLITISENLINLKDYGSCIGNKLVVSAYLYFEKPEKTCNERSGWDYFYNRSVVRQPDYETLSTYTYRDENLVEGRYGNTKTENILPINNNEQCCYDGNDPIEGVLMLQDRNKNKINNGVTYIDTFSTTQTNVNTNVGVGEGFNEWVRLTTEIDLNNFSSDSFYVSVEFLSGIFKCCDYNIYLDDIRVECKQLGFIETTYTEPCIGYDINRVIDNKKSWVYNPGVEEISDETNDNLIRGRGQSGMNLEETGVIRAGGHGSINRVFAPSVDAELNYRDTDYYNFHGVIEKHSKLVMNSKELVLQFNMCPDNDCLINPSFLLHDNGYVVDDEGGRIIIDEGSKFPNLVELERFKKTFQSFWVQFIEQFIPSTTIFIGGEKWCNNRICDEKVVGDYLLDVTNEDGVISDKIVDGAPKNKEKIKTILSQQFEDKLIGSVVGDTKSLGDTSTTNNGKIGVIEVGNYKLYALENLDPELQINVKYRNIV